MERPEISDVTTTEGTLSGGHDDNLNFNGLGASERTLLARLASFRGGCTLDALDEVLRTSWDHLDDPFDVLQSLVEKSLVLVEEPPRYRLPAELRDAVVDAMDSEERDVAMGRLFAWADGFCNRVAEGTTRADQEEWFDRAGLELDNVSDAIVYGHAHPELSLTALRMAVDMRHFWVVRGHYALGRSLVEPALDETEGIPSVLRASATNLVGVFALGMGDLDVAGQRLSESLALARQSGDAVAQGGVLVNLGMVAWERMEFIVARDAFQEASGILQTAEDWAKLGVALLNLGCVSIDMELLDQARTALEASREPLERGGNHNGLALTDANLGYLAIVRDQREEAFHYIRASLDAFGRLGNWKGTMNTLVSAVSLLAPADRESAATVRGAIEAMGHQEGSAPTPRDNLRLIEIDRAFDAGPDAEILAAARSKGLAMSPRHGIEYALSALSAIMPEGDSAKSATVS